MIRRATFYALLCAVLVGAENHAASVPFGPLMMAPSLGDARLAVSASDHGSALMLFEVSPRHDTHALTVCGWFRLIYPSSQKLEATTMASYVPEPIQRSNPDLSQGAFGFPGGTNLTGTLTVDPFAWQPYEPGVPSNLWPRGVYTVAGWSSNAVTVTVGGAALVLGPGAFNRNVIPASGSAVTVAGTGPVAVGVSRTPAHQFFGGVDGVVADGVVADGDYALTPESTVTNTYKFCAWRIKLTDTEHVYRSDMADAERAQCLGMVTTQDVPAAQHILSARGLYRVGFSGVAPGTNVTVQAFDARAFHRWLSDDELCRIHANGLQEIARRGIPMTAPRP